LKTGKYGITKHHSAHVNSRIIFSIERLKLCEGWPNEGSSTSFNLFKLLSLVYKVQCSEVRKLCNQIFPGSLELERMTI